MELDKSDSFGNDNCYLYSNFVLSNDKFIDTKGLMCMLLIKHNKTVYVCVIL